MFSGGESVVVPVQFHRHLHGAVRNVLLATGEPYVEDAMRVVLTGLAASDNAGLFMLDERARALIGTFREALLLSAREATDNFTLNAERQLNEFINLIHTTEETQ
jgi:hypothetical protein